MSQLGDTLRGVVEISKKSVRVLNINQTRDSLCTQLLDTAIHHRQVEMRGMSRWLLKMLAPSFSIYIQSLRTFREANTEGGSEIHQYILPKIQIHAIDNTIAQTVFQYAKSHKVSAIMIETVSLGAPSFAPVLFAAAIQTQYQGSLFLKTTLPRVSETQYNKAPEGTFKQLTQHIHSSVNSGFFGFEVEGPEELLKKTRDYLKKNTDFPQGSKPILNTDSESNHTGLLLGEQNTSQKNLEYHLEQYFRKVTTKANIAQMTVGEIVPFSLKNDLALAGMESKISEHHALFSSQS